MRVNRLATMKALMDDKQERLDQAQETIKQLQIYQGRADALDTQCRTLQASLEEQRSLVQGIRDELAQATTNLAVAQELANSRLNSQNDCSARLRVSEPTG